MEMYEVGGCVRDEILGLKSKDIDFSVVLSPDELPDPSLIVSKVTPYDTMRNKLTEMGFKIFLESPEFLTIRAQFPKTGEFQSIHVSPGRHGLTADFVLARKESDYTDGRRPDNVEVGTLYDDLARRDFSMNAIAKDADGNFIDPYDGRGDIDRRVIVAVGNAYDRLEEDALRAVRALRFSVTKNMRIDKELALAMEYPTVLNAIVNKIADERIADELSKMFRYSTIDAMYRMAEFPVLTRAVFTGRVSLDATLKQKGRGK